MFCSFHCYTTHDCIQETKLHENGIKLLTSIFSAKFLASFILSENAII